MNQPTPPLTDVEDSRLGRTITQLGDLVNELDDLLTDLSTSHLTEDGDPRDVLTVQRARALRGIADTVKRGADLYEVQS